MKAVDLLKSNFVRAILKITGKSFLPIVVLNFVFVLAICILIFGMVILIYGLGDNFLADITNGNFVQRIYSSIVKSLTNVTGQVTMFFLIFLSLFITTWYYNICFHIADEYFRTNKLNIASSLKESISIRLIKSFMVFLILLVTMIVVIIIASFFGAAFFEIGEGFGFTFVGILSAVVMVFFLRLVLVYPLALLSEKTILESFKESFRRVDFTLAIKYFLFSLLLLFAYGFINFTINYFSSSLLLYSTSFIIVSSLLKLMISSLVTALLVTLVLGVYYVHFPFIEKENMQIDLEENLIL